MPHFQKQKPPRIQRSKTVQKTHIPGRKPCIHADAPGNQAIESHFGWFILPMYSNSFIHTSFAASYLQLLPHRVAGCCASNLNLCRPQETGVGRLWAWLPRFNMIKLQWLKTDDQDHQDLVIPEPSDYCFFWPTCHANIRQWSIQCLIQCLATQKKWSHGIHTGWAMVRPFRQAAAAGFRWHLAFQFWKSCGN